MMGLETMQQYLTSVFGDNKLAMYGALAVLALIIVLVLWWGFLALFSGRVRAGGGRNRQPRLGVVDAYDLDRQRQLIIVRRDGVEHLVMIGGPNDVVIEAGIVRVPVPSRERAERDMQGATGTFMPESRAGTQIGSEFALPAHKTEEHPAANFAPAPTAGISTTNAVTKSVPDVSAEPVIPAEPVTPVVPVTLVVSASHAANDFAAKDFAGKDFAMEVTAAAAQRVAAPVPEPTPATPKSILARVAGRIISGAAPKKEEIEPSPPVASIALRQPQNFRPMEPVARFGAEIPTFAPRPPVEQAGAERAPPIHEPRVTAPEIMPPVPEFPIHKLEPPAAPVHSAEDRELLKQLQSWVPPEVPTVLEAARIEPPAAAPAATAVPPAPFARPALSTALPRPTFTPRTFTPMKPLNSPVKLQQLDASNADMAEKSAETAVKQMPLDELEEEMARLLGRPTKID